MKQGRVTCTADFENVPEFFLENWSSTKSENSVEALGWVSEFSFLFMSIYIDLLTAYETLVTQNLKYLLVLMKISILFKVISWMIT